jgi:hypothetical protein
METSTTHNVTDFEIQDHGIQNPSYWSGAAIAFSDWTEIGTGIGSSPGEALADAFEMLAQAGWRISDEIEEDALQEIGLDYAERETVSEALQEIEEDDLPPLAWTVSSGSWSGLSGIPETFETEEEARSEIAGRLREARSRGLLVGSVDGSSWEIHEPEDAGSVSDGAGWIRLGSNEEEREREREEIHERTEVVHIVSVRVR